MVSKALINKAIREANKSTHRHHLGAVIFRKKKVISKGYNIANKYVHRSTLPLKYRKYPTSVHAEMSAILAAKEDVKGASILIIRVNSRGLLMSSFPCPHCLLYLKYVGIRKIIYSTSEQKIEEFTL